ncbi:hypothetical protein JW859_12010 [bacterium]|nr:hypothetical protein [bacterium]
MTESQDIRSRRRGGDVVAVESLTTMEVLRRHIVVGSWFGHMLFVVWGMFFGFSYGGFGGMRFFTDMYLLDQLGSFSSLIGVLFGTFIGVVCVWAICVIVGAFGGALVYWFKFRSFPTSHS